MKRLVHYAAWLMFMLSGLTVLMESGACFRTAKQNERINALLSGQDIAIEAISSDPPETRLARAVYLVKQQRRDDALATLSAILNLGDARLQAKTRYNLGNLYLTQAITQVEAARLDEARTSATLAKQAYKQALLKDSRLWDAKYNLEVAMRLLPDFDRITVADEDVQQPKNPLWTTVPGFPRGLP